MNLGHRTINMPVEKIGRAEYRRFDQYCQFLLHGRVHGLPSLRQDQEASARRVAYGRHDTSLDVEGQCVAWASDTTAGRG
jgi:hypothetical protein